MESHFPAISQIFKAPIKLIGRYENQPREHFDEKKLKELQDSIEEIGQETPVPVIKVDRKPHKWELVDGERRWIVCGRLGRDLIVFETTVKDDDERFERSLAANFGRAEHTPLEIARAIDRVFNSKKMAELGKMERYERIAKKVGKSWGWAMQYHGLLRLHPTVQAMISPAVPEDQRMSSSLATFVSTLPHNLQIRIAKTTVKDGLSLRQARNLARRMADDKGIQIKGVLRKPSDDFRIFNSFFQRTYEDSEILLDTTKEKFTAMLARRQSGEVDEILRKLEIVGSRIKELKQCIERCRPKK